MKGTLGGGCMSYGTGTWVQQRTGRGAACSMVSLDATQVVASPNTMCRGKTHLLPRQAAVLVAVAQHGVLERQIVRRQQPRGGAQLALPAGQQLHPGQARHVQRHAAP